LLTVIEAAMYFDFPDDAESVELQRLRATSRAEDFASNICGIDGQHPLRPVLVATIGRTMG
jgi:mannitol-1-phosphate 5-dehydrogenase